MRRLITGIFLLITLFPALGFPEDGEEKEKTYDEGQYINVQFENDLFGNGADRHYTHGSRISFLTDEQPTNFEEKIKSTVLAPIPDFLIPKSRRISFILGQNIFTPEDITKSELIDEDRPYAGWLYLGAGFVSEGGGERRPFLENLEINLGVVGPASLAEHTQTQWHRLIGSKLPRGWDNQLENEPGLVIFYERKWPMRPPEQWTTWMDLTPHAGFALGNVYTFFATGLTLRVGNDLPNDYGPPRIRPGLSGSGFFKPTSRFTWYIFAGVEGRAVGRNIFLDGNTFADSHSVDKKTLVGDLQVGIVMTLFRNFRVGFTNIFRTKEFDGQPEPDDFGSFSLSYRW